MTRLSGDILHPCRFGGRRRMTALPGHGRFPYSAIGDRPHFTWPGGARLACYIAINLEHFAFGEGLGAELAPKHGQPDVLNWSWREYGNRVGVWRMLDLLDELGLPCAALVNGAIYDHCPSVPAAFRARGDEIVAHGRSNAERQGDLDEPAEARADRRGDAGADAGRGPGAARLARPMDLAEPGDARPPRRGRLRLPARLGDGRPAGVDGDARRRPHPLRALSAGAQRHSRRSIARQGEATAFCDRVVDGFDEMLDQSARQPLVFRTGAAPLPLRPAAPAAPPARRPEGDRASPRHLVDHTRRHRHGLRRR